MCYVIPLNKRKCIFGTRPGSLKQMKMKYILALWDGKCITPSVNKIIRIILIWYKIIPFVTLSVQIILSDFNGYRNSAWFTALFAVCSCTWIPVKLLQHSECAFFPPKCCHPSFRDIYWSTTKSSTSRSLIFNHLGALNCLCWMPITVCQSTACPSKWLCFVFVGAKVTEII